MTSNQNRMGNQDMEAIEQEKEIDLSEIFVTFWPFMPLALIIGLLCGIGAYSYGNGLPKTYTAVAKFVLNNESQSRDFELEGLIPGNGGSSESQIVHDKIMSRDFIVALFPLTGIDKDPFFTGENRRKGLIAWVRGLFSKSQPPTPPQAVAWVVDTFRNSVTVEISRNDLIDIMVSHTSADEAAKLANEIVSTYITGLKEKREELNDSQVQTMERRLIKAKERLDAAMEETRSFALENSVEPKEVLGIQSQQLTRFRRKLEQLATVIAGIEYLKQLRTVSGKSVVSSKEFSEANPAAFATLESLFNWSTGQTNLDVPPITTLETAQSSIKDESARLMRSIQLLEAETNDSANAVSRLLVRERDVAVAEALYKATVTQLEQQQTGAAMKIDHGEFIQTATPPLSPSAPRVLIITATAVLSGILATLIAGIAYVKSIGRLQTGSAIMRTAGRTSEARNVAKAVGKKPRQSARLLQYPAQVSNSELLALGFKVRDEPTPWVAVMGWPSTPETRNLAAFLAGVIADSSTSTAFVDLGHCRPSQKYLGAFGKFTSKESTGNITSLTWRDAPTKSGDTQSLAASLDEIGAKYERVVVLCAPLSRGTFYNTLVLSRAGAAVILTTPKLTKKEDLKQGQALLGNHDDIKCHFVTA